MGVVGAPALRRNNRRMRRQGPYIELSDPATFSADFSPG